MKSLVFFSAISGLIFSNSVFSIDYYVNSGTDNLTGSGSIESPYKNLSQIPTDNSSGDTSIFLKCGSVWKESLYIINSSKNTGSLNITRYGENCNENNLPVIDGSDPLTGWVVDPDDSSGEVYKTESHIGSNSSVLTTQLINQDTNSRYPVARYPNLDDTDGSMRMITHNSFDIEGTRQTQAHYLIDKNETSPFWSQNTNFDPTGAEIHIRNRNWRLQDRIVTHFDREAGELGWFELGPTSEDENDLLKISQPLISGSCNGCVAAGYSYYLANLKWMMDQPREWYQDRVSEVIYMRTDGSAPIDGDVAISIRDYGIQIVKQNNINISHVKIINSKYDAIRLDLTTNYHVNDVEISGAGASGLFVISRPEPDVVNSVMNNVVSNVSTAAIKIMSNTNQNKDVDDGWSTVVSNNVITDVGNLDYANPETHQHMKEGAWRNGISNSRGNAINMANDKNYLIDSNVINNTIHNGIFIGGASLKPKVVNNKVNYFCTILDDCGAIYFGGTSSLIEHAEVGGNIVGHGIGNSYGVVATTPLVYGVYLDSDAEEIDISNNIIHDVAGAGVFIHGAKNNTISDNLLFRNKKEIFLTENLESGVPKYTSAININGNKFVHLDDSEIVSIHSVFDRYDAIDDMGEFDNNYYFSAQADKSVSEKFVGGTSSYSLSEWKELRGQDSLSIEFDDYMFASQYVSDILSDELISNSGFDSGIESWGCWFSGKSGSDCLINNDDPYRIWSSNCDLNGDGCMTIASSSTKNMSAIKSNLMIEKGSDYILEFIVRGTEDDQKGSTIIRRTNQSGDGWGSLGLNLKINAGLNPVYIKHDFKAVDDYQKAAAYIYTDVGNALQIDDYSLLKVATVPLNIDEVSVLLVNETNTSQTFSNSVLSGVLNLDATYVNEFGVSVCPHGSLNPGERMVLIAYQHSHQDTDRDGVIDGNPDAAYSDQCADTAPGESTEKFGCSYDQNHQ